MDLNEEDSVVLITNYHVIIAGLPELYENAKEVTKDMKEEILKNARKSEIMVEKEKIKLSGGMLVESSCKMSSAKSVCTYVQIHMHFTTLLVCVWEDQSKNQTIASICHKMSSVLYGKYRKYSTVILIMVCINNPP